jgi:Fe-S cluster assembly ATP-binding protein
MLTVKNLKVKIEDKNILNGVNLSVGEGEVCALMGKNGSGKSTLAQVLVGNPLYTVSSGSVKVSKKDLLKLSPEERAQAGLFLSFQHPVEIEGVNLASYLRLIYNKKHGTKLSPVKFRKLLKEKTEILEIDDGLLARGLNEGFSGGEKKKLEMVQMLLLEPKVAILDEVDSGLDVDSMKTISKAINYLHEKTNTSVLLITHYNRILNYITPDKVFVMSEGKITREGGPELAKNIESKGYSSSDANSSAK